MGEFKKLVFSGVQPTGNLHLGNYLGAIRKFVALQDGNDCIYCVVDLHSITAQLVHEDLRGQIRSIAAAFIASGIDPEKHIVFNQSAVPQHAELAWIFNCVARIGWMNRMTQFKDKAGKDRENASLGLLAYPSLMAADILVYRATHVPVGEDQKQHLELTRDIAELGRREFGIERNWHKRIVRAGPNTLAPYDDNPPDLLIGEDDILFLDLGPVFEAWEADFGRTYVLDNYYEALSDALQTAVTTVLQDGSFVRALAGQRAG